MVTRVYVVDTNIKIGQAVVGWDERKLELVKTTPVERIQVASNGNVLVETQEGGQYVLTNRR